MRVRPDRGSFERSAQGFALAPVWTELLADVSTPVGAGRYRTGRIDCNQWTLS